MSKIRITGTKKLGQGGPTQLLGHVERDGKRTEAFNTTLTHPSTRHNPSALKKIKKRRRKRAENRTNAQRARESEFRGKKSTEGGLP